MLCVDFVRAMRDMTAVCCSVLQCVAVCVAVCAVCVVWSL